jgi:hypothetical protein
MSAFGNRKLELHSRARLSCVGLDDEQLILCGLCGAFCANSIFMYHDASYCSAACRRHAMQPPTLQAVESSFDEPELSDCSSQ